MKPRNHTSYRFVLTIVATSFLVALTACGEYRVPITEQPTRRIDERLIGNWISRDRAESINVRTLNHSTYVVSYSGILLRAFHSDIGGVSFINAQDLETPERNYLYVTYRLSADGRKLYVRVVSDEIVPDTTKDSATVQKLLKNNLQNPRLFETEGEFIRKQ